MPDHDCTARGWHPADCAELGRTLDADGMLTGNGYLQIRPDHQARALDPTTVLLVNEPQPTHNQAWVGTHHFTGPDHLTRPDHEREGGSKV